MRSYVKKRDRRPLVRAAIEASRRGLPYPPLPLRYMSGWNLSGIIFRRLPLAGANLRGANLRSCHLANCDLRGADLRGADLRGANFTGSDLRGVDFTDSDLRGACFLRCQLVGASFFSAKIEGAQFPVDTFALSSNLQMNPNERNPCDDR